MGTKTKTITMKAGFNLALALLFVAVMSSLQKDTPEITELNIGQKMPMTNYTMTGTDDTQYSLSDLMGENGLIVVFSCNTCPFVVGSSSFDGWEGQYNNIYSKAKTQGIEMVLVNSNAAKRDGDDSPSKMKEHKEALGYEMPYVVDINAKLADAFGAKTTPHIFMFDNSNTLIFKGSIDNSWDTKRDSLETYLLDAIDAVSKGDAIPVSSSTPRGCSIKRVK